MLEKLFNPESIAVIGASRTPGKVGHDILKNLLAGNFSGKIIPINPSCDTILDLDCHKSLAEYGQHVDLCIIVIPSKAVIEATRDAIKAKAKAVVVISAGFKETGEEGREREEAIRDICHSGSARLLGPNCLGLINTTVGLNASFAGFMPEKGGISIFSQSGALCTAMLDLAASRHLGLGKLVSIGNKADISEVDMLNELAHDDDTKVIVGYLEDIISGDEFIKAAETASAVKPVVILKSGTTPAGQKAAASHTGVLAGSETAYGAAFKRSGVIRADTFDALFDYAALFSMQPLLKGKRILIITNAGGPGTMAADTVEKAGLEVAELDYNTASALKDKLPRAASIGNPIDVLGDADPERYAEAVKVGQADDSVDGIVVILTPQAMTQPAATAKAIANELNGSKPVVAAFMGGTEVMPGRDELARAGLPDYDSPERAVDALRAMHEYALWRNRPPRRVTRFRVNRRKVERIIRRHQQTDRLFLGEVRAKDILKAYGFNTPGGRLASSPDEAVEIARMLGFPVAMKIVSPNIIHKTDLGGVKLNLTNPAQVEDAFDLMMLRTRQKAPKAAIEGVFVEKMADKGMEVIIGMHRDEQFGPMLMFGLGGIFVEVMKDVTFHLAPITEGEAIQMLKATRSYEMLEGKRGRKGVDISAIANCMQRISQLTTDFPQIRELDINPLIITDNEPVVVDARMTLDEINVMGRTSI